MIHARTVLVLKYRGVKAYAKSRLRIKGEEFQLSDLTTIEVIPRNSLPFLILNVSDVQRFSVNN